MLDSNVWRYLVDESADAAQRLKRNADACSVQIVACPAVAYEALYTEDAALRRRLIKAITLGAWSRLMPEAYRETAELFEVIAHRRPAWLRTAQSTSNWYRLQAHWSGGGWWRRVREQPDRESAVIQGISAENLRGAREQAHRRRQQALTLDRSRGAPLRRRLVDEIKWWPDWLDEDVEPWRIEGFAWWSAALMGDPLRTPRDWIEPWVDIRRILAEMKSWLELWTHEATPTELPLHRLRSAMGDLQADQKVTPGTPVDNQIGTYLPYVGHFATADRRFLAMIEDLQRLSSLTLARGHMIKAQGAVVEQLTEIMWKLAPS